MFNKKNRKLITEREYRAEIKFYRNTQNWGFFVERRVGYDEWQLIITNEFGKFFKTKQEAEKAARKQIEIQKNLDKDEIDPISYVIYPD